MSARLIILAVLAGGLGVYLAVRPKSSANVAEGPDVMVMAASGQNAADIVQETVSQQPISGVEPAEKPDFRVQLEVDPGNSKSNRLMITISETHGFYADTFDLMIWRKGPGVEGPADSDLSFSMHVNNFLRANGSLRTCLDIVPAELARVGGDMGSSEDWDVQLTRYGRAREADPEPLPRVSSSVASVCD